MSPEEGMKEACLRCGRELKTECQGCQGGAAIEGSFQEEGPAAVRGPMNGKWGYRGQCGEILRNMT